MDDAEERYTNPMTKPPDEYILSESEDPAWTISITFNALDETHIEQGDGNVRDTIVLTYYQVQELVATLSRRLATLTAYMDEEGSAS